MFCVFIAYSITNRVFWVSKLRPRETEYCMDSTEYVPHTNGSVPSCLIFFNIQNVRLLVLFII